MRVIVCGGRNFLDAARLDLALDGLMPTAVAQGGAPGADRLALKWCMKRHVPCHTFPADWSGHGKAAGPLRNQKMLESFKPELVLAFPGGVGTKDMIRKAKKAGVEVVEFQ